MVVLAGGMSAMRKLPRTGRPADKWRVRMPVAMFAGGWVGS